MRLRMVGGHQGDQRFACHRLPFEMVGHRLERPGELDFAGHHHLFEAAAAMFHQTDLDAGIAAAKAREHWREQRTAAQRRQAQAQHAALQALQIVQLGPQIVAFGQHGDGAPVHDLAGRRQP